MASRASSAVLVCTPRRYQWQAIVDSQQTARYPAKVHGIRVRVKIRSLPAFCTLHPALNLTSIADLALINCLLPWNRTKSPFWIITSNNYKLYAQCFLACNAVANSNAHRLTTPQSVRAHPEATLNRRTSATSTRPRTGSRQKHAALLISIAKYCCQKILELKYS